MRYSDEKNMVGLPLVSIVIPVYNAAAFLGECIDSLISQNYNNLEIICINDGSTDASAQILEYYKSKDARIICVHQENAGQSIARNKGISIATGDYICFLDSDDFLIPNAVLQCIETFQKHRVDIVLFNMEMFLPSGQHFKCFAGELYNHHESIFSSKESEICINFTNAAAGMYKRKDLIENHVLFPAGMIYEDWVFMVRLMTAKDFSIFWLDSSLYWYRRDFAQTTTSNISNKCLDLFKAYHMANKQLRLDTNRQHQLFINDEKIVNEAIGFLITRLRTGVDRSILRSFVQEFMNVLNAFPEVYMQNLNSFLAVERAEIARFLYQNLEQNDIDALIKQLQTRLQRQYCKEKIRNVKNKLCRVVSIIYSRLKKVLNYVSPTYRVSSDSREKINYLLCQNDQLNNQIQQLKESVLMFAKSDFNAEKDSDEAE